MFTQFLVHIYWLISEILSDLRNLNSFDITVNATEWHTDNRL